MYRCAFAALMVSFTVFAGRQAKALVYVTAGQHYESLHVSGEDFMMNGGRVDRLFLDDGNFRIVEGSVGDVELRRGHFEIWGGTFDGDIVRTAASKLDLRGFHFRVDEVTRRDDGIMRVEGITASHDFYQGIYVGFNVVNRSSLPERFVPSEFYAYSQVNPLDNGLHTLGDLDHDFDVELADLNVARNCFGVTEVCEGRRQATDLEDLNNVRNFFNYFPYTLDESLSVPYTCSLGMACNTGIVFPRGAAAVPEPTSIGLLVMMAGIAAIPAARHASGG